MKRKLVPACSPCLNINPPNSNYLLLQLEQPVLKTISGKSDKKAFDLVDHCKVVSFLDEDSIDGIAFHTFNKQQMHHIVL